MTKKSPNLVFIMTDHQRADSLGMVQAGIEVTPNLNRLASESTHFKRAYNTCPLCVPTRTALFTGKYPTKNGVVFNDWEGTRAGNHIPLHQHVAEAGYDVAHIGVHHIRVKPPLEKRVPFVKWISNEDYTQYLANHGIQEWDPETQEAFRKPVMEKRGAKFVERKCSNTKTGPWPYALAHFKDEYFCRQSVEFLSRSHSDKPFALFVYLWAPHPPLRVPEPYASLFPPDELDLPANVGLPAQGEPPNRRQGVAAQLAEGVSMDEWRKVWAAHLGLVHLADAGIGRILQALKTSGHMEDTITVFTVDHGDHLGQHKMYQKMEMYEQAIHIPLMFRGPGIQAQSFTTPVSHLDIMPTLLDLLDLQTTDNDLDGVSLAESLVSSVPPETRPVFSQYSGDPTVGDIRRAVITQRYKYVYDPTDIPELYDLEGDPLEMQNLAIGDSHTGIIKEMHQIGKTWARAHDDWVEF
jgi:arylsulfatase A-like enzyme